MFPWVIREVSTDYGRTPRVLTTVFKKALISLMFKLFFYKTIYFSPENGQVEKLRFHTHKMVFGLKCMITLESRIVVSCKVV